MANLPKKQRVRGPSRPLQVTYAEIARLSGITPRTARAYAATKYDAADLQDVVRFINMHRAKRERPPIDQPDAIDAISKRRAQTGCTLAEAVRSLTAADVI